MLVRGISRWDVRTVVVLALRDMTCSLSRVGVSTVPGLLKRTARQRGAGEGKMCYCVGYGTLLKCMGHGNVHSGVQGRIVRT